MANYKIISNACIFFVAISIVTVWAAAVLGCAAGVASVFFSCLILTPFVIWGGIKLLDFVFDWEIEQEKKERAAQRAAILNK